MLRRGKQIASVGAAGLAQRVSERRGNANA
jgi:hypothetical protein